MSEPTQWKFLVLNKNQSLEVSVRQRVTVGRDASNDLLLQDDEVSRSHAIIYVVEDGQHAGKVAVKDLNSLNGILVNGKRLRGAVLNPGDELILGGTIMLFSPGSEKDIEECLSSKGRTILKRIGAPKPFVPASVETLTVESLAAMAVDLLTDGTTTAFWSRFDARTMFLRMVEMSRMKDEGQFFQAVLQTALQATKADRGVIMTADSQDHSLSIRALVTNQDDQTIFISQSIVKNVMKTRKAICSLDVAGDDRFSDLHQQASSQKPSSLLALPLEGAEGPIGFIYLDSFKDDVLMDQDCLMLLSLVLQPVMQFSVIQAVGGKSN